MKPDGKRNLRKVQEITNIITHEVASSFDPFTREMTHRYGFVRSSFTCSSGIESLAITGITFGSTRASPVISSI